eukprot:COSAG05_NODE_960_length_6421_cov_17.990668_4_plen_114_part_00
MKALYKDFINGYKQCHPCSKAIFDFVNRKANNFVTVCVSCGRQCVARRTSQRYLCYYYHMRNNSHSAPSAMAAAFKKHYWWPTETASKGNSLRPKCFIWETHIRNSRNSVGHQ